MTTTTHLAIYERMRSLTYRMDLVRQRTDHIHRVIARDQWAALALIPRRQEKVFARRIRYWQHQVQIAEARAQGLLED